MRNFKELKIWQKGIEIAINCYQLTNSFPSVEKYNLYSQINRCGVSIPSNIAEGSSRNSDKDYNRFIEISLGSSYELETHLLISKALAYGNQDMLNDLLLSVVEEQKMIAGFMNSLK